MQHSLTSNKLNPTQQQTKAQGKRTAAPHAHQRHQELEGTKKQAAWYAAAPEPPTTSSGLPRTVILQRLRLGYSTREELELR